MSESHLRFMERTRPDGLDKEAVRWALVEIEKLRDRLTPEPIMTDPKTDEPAAQEAKIYMEICASLMTKFGASEVEIDLADVPNKPFQLWRRVDDGKLTVRLIWDEKQRVS